MDSEEGRSFRKVLKEISRCIGVDWKRLGRQLGHEEPALQNLELKHQPDYEEVSYQTLYTWRNKNGEAATVPVLLCCLEEIDRNDIVIKILKLLPDRDVTNWRDSMRNFGYPPGKIRSNIQEKLKTRYTDPPPWNPWNPAEVAEVYSDLQLITKKRNATHTELENVFDNVEGGKPYRILIEGGAGLGKTTIARKLTADWTAGKEYISTCFELLFLISLKNFEFDDIDEALQCMGKLTNVADKTILDTITQNDSEDVLVILDGYDELPPEKRECIIPLLKSETYPKMTVIVTCRTNEFSSYCGCQEPVPDSKDQTVNDRFGFWRKKILITGMKPEQQLILLKEILGDDKYKPNKKEINRLLEDLKELLCCPMFLFMFAMLIKESPVTIETKTQLYISFINLMITRASVSKDPLDLLQALKNQISSKVNDDARAVDRIVRVLTEFGGLALKKTKGSKCKFSKEEIINTEREESQGLLNKLGMLTTTSDNCYIANHHSLVEFLIACHLFVSLGKADETSNEYWLQTITVVRNHYSLVLPFLAGLLENDSYKLFELLSPFSFEYCACISYLVPILLECTISEKLKTSLTFFLPVLWPIPCCRPEDGFVSTPKHEAIVKHGIQEKRIKVLYWQINGRVAICDHTEVENLSFVISGPFMEHEINVPHIKCNDLKIILFDYDMTEERWEVFLNCICKIEANTMSLHVMNSAEKWLPALHYEMFDGKLKGFTFQWIRCCLGGKKEHLMPMLTEIIKKTKTCGLELVFDQASQTDLAFDKAFQIDRSSGPTLCSSRKSCITKECDNVKPRQIRSIMRKIKDSDTALSVHLHDRERAAVKYTENSEEGKWLGINIGTLSGKKWIWLRFWSVSLDKESQDDIEISVEHLDLVDVQYSPELVETLSLCQIKCLSIDSAFLGESPLDVSLCRFFEELDLLDVVIHETFDWKTVFNNLKYFLNKISVLALTMPFTELDTFFPAKDFISLLLPSTKLKALHFYGVNRSTNMIRSIMTELQNALKKARPLHISEISLHAQSYTEYANTMTNDMFEFKEILVQGKALLKDQFLKSLKIVCPYNSLPDFVANPHADASLVTIFPYAESFRITHDITGMKKEDPLNYRHDFGLFTGYHRFSVELCTS